MSGLYEFEHKVGEVWMKHRATKRWSEWHAVAQGYGDRVVRVTLPVKGGPALAYEGPANEMPAVEPHRSALRAPGKAGPLRGFAAMGPERQRAIASKGGKAAHERGVAHQFSPEEARAAGRKGGLAVQAKGTGHRFTPSEAAAAGRKGGKVAQAAGASGHVFTDADRAKAGAATKKLHARA